MPRNQTRSAVLEDTENTEVIEDANAARQVEEATAKTETEQQLKNRLRNEAEREVLDNHRAEFYELAEKKFTENGLKFQRRLTEAEKAEKKVRELLDANPGLREKFAARVEGAPAE